MPIVTLGLGEIIRFYYKLKICKHIYASGSSPCILSDSTIAYNPMSCFIEQISLRLRRAFAADPKQNFDQTEGEVRFKESRKITLYPY